MEKEINNSRSYIACVTLLECIWQGAALIFYYEFEDGLELFRRNHEPGITADEL